MPFRLVPRDEGFYGLFNLAAENAAECTRRLLDMVTHYEDVENKLSRVIECESRGDKLTDDLMRRLDTSFVTPFDREDIHALTEGLDDVVDDVLAAADLLVLHHVERPLPEMAELAGILVRAAETNVTLLAKLSKMRGLEGELEAVDALESEGDRVYRRTVAKLFSGEYEAFDVLKWKDVVEALEKALNEVESVSNVVESIVLKHA